MRTPKTTSIPFRLFKFIFSAVFVVAISRLPENKDKNLNEIDWSRYDPEMGYTLELCAGIIDKELPVKDIAKEEVLEECGYAITVDQLRSVATDRKSVV